MECDGSTVLEKKGEEGGNGRKGLEMRRYEGNL
jgi:hypothetical protein